MSDDRGTRIPREAQDLPRDETRSVPKREEDSSSTHPRTWSPEQVAASRRVLGVLLATRGLCRQDLDAALKRPRGSTSRFLRDKEPFSLRKLEEMLAVIGVRMEEFLRLRDACLRQAPPRSSPFPAPPPAPPSFDDVLRKLDDIFQLLQHSLSGDADPS